MAETKYGELIKGLKFQNYDRGCIRQEAIMDREFLGIDAYIRYGACWNAGRMGKPVSGEYLPHVHDFDQVMIFVGSDMTDMSDLGAEIELCLGPELETHITTTSAAVAIPKGFPHFDATINSMNRRFIFMEVSVTPEYKETPVRTDRKPTPPLGWKSLYKKNISLLSFHRKGAWYYGPENRDDGGGSIAFVRTQEAGIDFVMLYENMKKAPYRIGPDAFPHTHATTQAMCFLGTNPDDLTEFGAEFEICMGKEEERHVFTKPTCVLAPPFLPHWPGGVLKLSKPIIMADIHPFGNDH